MTGAEAPVRPGPRAFEGVRDDLVNILQEEISNARTPEDRVAIPRSIFRRHHDVVEELYASTGSDRNRSARDFWFAIVGDGEAKSRARIFAILLLLHVDCRGRTWERFEAGLWLDQEQFERPFVDESLPFYENEIQTHIGDEHSKLFFEKQDHFCPPLKTQWTDRCNDIRKLVDDAMVQCKPEDSKGMPTPEYMERFCPDPKAYAIWEGNKILLQNLYVESVKACLLGRLVGSSMTASEQRTNVQQARVDSAAFLHGARPRFKMFLALMDIKIDATSEAWLAFTGICCDSQQTVAALLDKDMPFPEDRLKEVLRCNDSECRVLFDSQYNFCAVLLKKKTHVEPPEPKKRLRLPLLKKQALYDKSSSAGGELSKVIVAGGHLFEVDKPLAMKRLYSDQDLEWDRLNKLSEQELKPESIMRARASVRMADGIHIFFNLADSDLYAYMVKHNPGGPKDHQERKYLFNLIVNVAQALNYLHSDCYDEQKEISMYHQDLKAENVLVSWESPDKPLRFYITDFGISSVQQTSEYVRATSRNPTPISSRPPRSNPTRTLLADYCTNFAPEACDDGYVTAKADVWAFGVLFTEFLAWLAGGRDALRKFEKARLSTDDLLSFEFEDPKKHRRPVLKRVIKAWFTSLCKDEKWTEDERLFFQGSWQVLENMLLQCEPSKRCHMGLVQTQLGRVYRGERVSILKAEPWKWPRRPPRRPTVSAEPIQDVAMPDLTEVCSTIYDGRITNLWQLHEKMCLLDVDAALAVELQQRCYRCPDSAGGCVLLDLCRMGMSHTVKVVVPHCQHVEECNGEGKTPLLLALSERKETVGSVLLDAGANVEASDKKGWTALHFAIKEALSCDIARQILHKASQNNKSIVNQRNFTGRTPLHLCAELNDPVAEELAGLLIDHGADRSARTKSGNTPFQLAKKAQGGAVRREEMSRLLRTEDGGQGSGRCETPQSSLSSSNSN
jgi:serine/threonine protein kinase